ncbi:MAG: tol-pal system protein YbgF [uncultured bacterium]|nr:MAG: tol-pal system protein YbgF [uncultured bacterium]
MRNKKLILIGLVVYSFTAINHLYAGDKKLEEDVAELRRILDAQSKNLATSTAQVQEMVSEFQKISGLVDQTGHGTEQQSKILTDNQRRLEVLEEKLQQLLTQLEELKAAGLLPTSSIKDLGEFKVFEGALSKINGSDYKGAVVSLQDFITKNPKSRFADAAQYWIGESFYSIRDFPKAISEYQKVIKDFPKSNKVALSMLKQGFSFYEMQSFEDAKAFLSKIAAKYPGSNEAVRAKDKIDEINKLEEEKALQAAEKKATM